jgi:hypothetical protein
MKTSLVLLCLVGAAGCAVHAQPLASLPLCTCARVEPHERTEKRILIAPFEDERGGEYTRQSPDRYIPVVSWFHSAEQIHYPEQAGMLRSRDHSRHTVTVGELGAAMPSLLSDMMRRMQLTNNAVAGKVLETPPQDYDYVIAGRLKRTRFRADRSAVLHLALGLVGVPYEFAAYDLEYEIVMFDTRNPATPIFRRTYVYRDKRAVGVYYNQEWAYPMFVRGLEQTLPEVVRDVAAIVHAAG